MKAHWWLAAAFLCQFGLSSCFLVSVPVKAAGEIVEKSAYATRDLGARGIRKLRQPAEPDPYQDPGYYQDPAAEGVPDYGSDAYYENQ